jgi:hypothetical protein
MHTTDRKLTLAVLLLAIAGILQGCSTVKPYQRAYLNDAAMRPGKTDIEKFDISVHTYREGASGGGNGKTSGGCGCN